MSNVSIDKVKALRSSTGAKLTECHKALSDSGGDVEAAKDLLRIMGLGGAASKAERDATEGSVGFFVNDSKALVVRLCTETDFVAMNSICVNLAQAIGTALLSVSDTNNEDEVNMARLPDGNTIDEAIKLTSSATGEKIALGAIRVMRLEPDVTLGAYVHNKFAPNIGKSIALVTLTGGHHPSVEKLAHQVGMHISAMEPAALDRNSMDPAVVQRELHVVTERAKNSGKPANIIQKITQGAMDKFYREHVLLEQIFAINTQEDFTIQQMLDNLSKEVGFTVSIGAYCLDKVS